jgi:hypothetical protein
VISTYTVAKLMSVMLFVLVKQLHSTQGGKAAAAAPRTGLSGRVKQKKATSSSASSNKVVTVRPHTPVYHRQLQCSRQGCKERARMVCAVDTVGDQRGRALSMHAKGRQQHSAWLSTLL